MPAVAAATQVPAAAAATQVPAAAAATEKTVLVNGVPFKVPVGKDKSKIEIPIVYMNITTPFAQSIKQGVDAAAKEFGVNGYMTGPTDWSTEAQIAVIENLLAKDVDGISIAILDIPGLTPMVQKSIEKQIPVTCFNVDAPESGRLSFVGEDLFKAGEEVGNALVEYMGENGTVLISTEAIDAIWSQARGGHPSRLGQIPRHQGVADAQLHQRPTEVVRHARKRASGQPGCYRPLLVRRDLLRLLQASER